MNYLENVEVVRTVVQGYKKEVWLAVHTRVVGIFRLFEYA